MAVTSARAGVRTSQHLFPPSSLQPDRGIGGAGGWVSFLLRVLIVSKATRLSRNLTRMEAGVSARRLGLVHARALWPTWGFRSQRNQSRWGVVSTSGGFMPTALCVLRHLPEPRAFKLVTPQWECQVSWVTEENVSQMHVEDGVRQALYLCTGFD